MANQIAVKVHCLPGDEILCEENCHIYNYEQGAYAQLMTNLSRFGSLDEMEVIFNDVEISVEGTEARIENIQVRAPLRDMTMGYELERRDGR